MKTKNWKSSLLRLWTKTKNWIARRRIESIAKCHQHAIPVWADWVGNKIVGVVVRRTDDPNHAHDCYGILVLSSQMDWQTALEHICKYLGCEREDAPIYFNQLRGRIELDIVLLRRVCEVLHAIKEVKENVGAERGAQGRKVG
ncbi:MAG: hypothetical protein RQ862_01875 [Candidatus Caldarchaeales archaeon]|nr:hypothetical protein [Candidatus Caldarchaeales archaeon]